MGQFEMTYPLEASCAVSEVSLPLQDYFRNVEEESSAALRKEVFRFFHFYRCLMEQFDMNSPLEACTFSYESLVLPKSLVLSESLAGRGVGRSVLLMLQVFVFFL
jgi:hypothetical protein